MIRLLVYLFSLFALVFGAYWLWNHNAQARIIMTEAKEFVETQLHSGNFHTLEERFTPERIMEMHEKDLLKSSRHEFLPAFKHFYPYLLMEVKYTQKNGSTKEGMILWGLADGEMVLNTADWKTTHGFEDCINAKATRDDFKIINSLAVHGGRLDREGLLKSLPLDHEILDSWIDSCRAKKLIIRKGNAYLLHFEKPLLNVDPVTHIDQALVTKPFKGSVRYQERYYDEQVKQVAIHKFGNNFAIRQSSKVYLPVYGIQVQNPDGSILTSYWNALTGKQMDNPGIL